MKAQCAVQPWVALALVTLLRLASPACAQRPILEVRLVGVGQILIEGRLTPDGTLELPVPPLEELTGEKFGELEFLSLAELSKALGSQIELEYHPRMALLVLRDPLGTLAATRHAYDRRLAEARSVPRAFTSAGPFGALTADMDGGRLVEVGWNFGWLAVDGSHSTVGNARWALSVRPLTHTWLSYTDGDLGQPAHFGLRWASGRTFIQSTYSPDHGVVRGQAASSWRRWTAFVQDDGSAAITFRGDVHVAIARTPKGYATRLSFGRNPSPLSLPRVR